MRAIVYHGPGDKRWEEVPDPKLVDDTDAIARVDTVTICGTDLHILKGDVPEVTPGRILGHEAVGTILETGPSVRASKRTTGCCCRASPPAEAAASAVRASTASAWAVAAGSSGT